MRRLSRRKEIKDLDQKIMICNQEIQVEIVKCAKKYLRDRWTDGQLIRPTDQMTYRVRCTPLKVRISNYCMWINVWKISRTGFDIGKVIDIITAWTREWTHLDLRTRACPGPLYFRRGANPTPLRPLITWASNTSLRHSTCDGNVKFLFISTIISLSSCCCRRLGIK